MTDSDEEHWLDAAVDCHLCTPEIAAKACIEIGRRDNRIRELKEDYQEAINQMIEAKLEKEEADKRIAELLMLLDGMQAIKAGTHVIVPVEPTERMLRKGREKGGNGFYHLENAYQAMIRAAQETNDDG